MFSWLQFSSLIRAGFGVCLELSTFLGLCLVIIQSALRTVHAQEMTATHRRGMVCSQELALELPLAQSPKPTEFCR
jgi:hypothetical protein